MTVDPTRMQRLVAQHAETTRLLGVDFIPVRRDAAMAPTSQHPPSITPTAADPEKPVMPPKEPTQPTRPTLTGEAAERQARLDALRQRYENEAPHQHFVTDHTNIVFGEGDPCARLMFVGEAPGAEEDKTGRPFVGRAGQLLEKMIVAMGLSREAVYICNVLKTRPPNNQTPTTEEARLCAPYLVEQISIVEPEVIVVLGLTAARLLLETSESMGRLRGTWHTFPPEGGVVPNAGSIWSTNGIDEGMKIAVMPTYHPAYLLRSYTADNRRKVWSDLQMVMERLGLESGTSRPGT